jgi:hypothetical protein
MKEIMNSIIEFLFPRRLHRLEFFLRDLVLAVPLYFIYSCSTTMNPVFWWTSVVALSLYELFFITLPRVRDIGINGWWLLLLFVPIANAIFAYILLFRAPSFAPRQKTSPSPAIAVSLPD